MGAGVKIDATVGDGPLGPVPAGVEEGGSVNSDIAPSCGADTYSAVLSALTTTPLELTNTLADLHGDPGRGEPCMQPRRLSKPVAGSRAKATTLAELFEVTYTVSPSGLTATPSAPSSEGVGVHAPVSPSRTSVPSELKHPAGEIAPVVWSRLRIARLP